MHQENQKHQQREASRKNKSEVVDVGPRFKDLKPIASGAYGQVYTTRDIQDNRVCVLKVEDLNTDYPSLADEAEFLEHL